MDRRLERIAKSTGFEYGETRWYVGKNEYVGWLYWTDRQVPKEFETACDMMFGANDSVGYYFQSDLNKLMRKKGYAFPEVDTDYRGEGYYDKYKELIGAEVQKAGPSLIVASEEVERIEAVLSGIRLFVKRLEDRRNILDELMRRVLKAWLWYAWSVTPSPRPGSHWANWVEWRLATGVQRVTSVYWRGNQAPHKIPDGKYLRPADRKTAILMAIVEEAADLYRNFRLGQMEVESDNEDIEYINGLFNCWEGVGVMAEAQRHGAKFLLSESRHLRIARNLLEPRKQVAEHALWSALTGEPLPTTDIIEEWVQQHRQVRRQSRPQTIEKYARALVAVLLRPHPKRPAERWDSFPDWQPETPPNKLFEEIESHLGMNGNPAGNSARRTLEALCGGGYLPIEWADDGPPSITEWIKGARVLASTRQQAEGRR